MVLNFACCISGSERDLYDETQEEGVFALATAESSAINSPGLAPKKSGSLMSTKKSGSLLFRSQRSQSGLQRISSQVGFDTPSDQETRLAALGNLMHRYYAKDYDILEADLRCLKNEDPKPTLGKLAKAASQNFASKCTGEQMEQSLDECSAVSDASQADDEELSGSVEDEYRAERARRRKQMENRMADRLAALEESAPSRSLQIDIHNPGELKDMYQHKRKLGDGEFGEVWVGKLIATGALRAIRSVPLRHQNMKLLKMEMEVCKAVDHPNIVKLYEVFEDKAHRHLVMELCTGGVLSQRIPQEMGLSEPEAAVAMKQIIRAVRYLHESWICHRNLKTDNVVLVRDKSTVSLQNRLRLTDFSLSCFFKKDQILKVNCGTVTHTAPEVFGNKYDYRCDVWGVGVMMYAILGGRLPFNGENQDDTKARILKGKIMWLAGWLSRSPEAKKLAQRFLRVDPNKRITLEDALNDEWLSMQHPKQAFVPITDNIVKNLRGYRGLNKFKKASLNVIASLQPEVRISKARDAFLELDRDGNGSVSLAELREVLARLKPSGVEMDDVDQACMAIFFEPTAADDDAAVKDLRKRVSYLNDQQMPDFSYTEFLAATLNRKTISKDVCRVAFQCFDKDRDGTISKEELMFGRLLGKMSPDERDRLVEDLDVNGDGEIDFDEFVDMMRDEAGWVRCFQTAGNKAIISDEKMDLLSKALPTA